MLVGKGSWQKLRHFLGTPENLWNFFQVPLAQDSRSILHDQKEGLCFLGIPFEKRWSNDGR